MQPSKLDLYTIRRESGAQIVTVTGGKGWCIDCELMFRQNGMTAITQATFDLANEAQIKEACAQVRAEIQQVYQIGG